MTLKQFEEMLKSTSQNPKQYLSDSQKIIKHYLKQNNIAGAYHFAKGLTLEDAEIQLFMNQSFDEISADYEQTNNDVETENQDILNGNTETPIVETKIVKTNNDKQTQNIVIAKRDAVGADLYDIDNNNYIRHIGENIVRDFNINHNDHILLDDTNRIIEVVKVSNHNDPNYIETFNNGIVMTDDKTGDLIVTNNINGELLSDYHPNLTEYVIPKIFQDPNSQVTPINDGDIVDLAWKTSDDYVKIRWITATEELPEKVSNTTSKVVKTTKNKSVTTTIDFDLDGQTVSIVAGDNIREKEYQELIQLHNGELNMIDGFQKTPLAYELALTKSKSDLIILVQNYSKHLTSNSIFNFAKRNKIPIAISQSAGLQSIERAIYRALNGYAAHETSSADVDYPML